MPLNTASTLYPASTRPTTDAELLKPMVSVSGKLAVKPACERLRSHGVFLSTVEFLVGSIDQLTTLKMTLDCGAPVTFVPAILLS
jgi:hypothetical protein